MSMLSAQCDKLREMAVELRTHGTFVGFGGLTSTDPLMLKSATLMCEAADTIWELRCKLSGMVDERERARVAEAENVELRELLAKARDPQRIGGQADPSSFAYAIEQLREFRWQHATNDEEAIPYINNVVAAHERENAKLRELCEMFAEYVSQDRCEGCVVKRRCNEGDIEECWQLAEIRKVAGELRIEVE